MRWGSSISNFGRNYSLKMISLFRSKGRQTTCDSVIFIGCISPIPVSWKKLRFSLSPKSTEHLFHRSSIILPPYAYLSLSTLQAITYIPCQPDQACVDESIVPSSGVEQTSLLADPIQSDPNKSPKHQCTTHQVYSNPHTHTIRPSVCHYLLQ